MCDIRPDHNLHLKFFHRGRKCLAVRFSSIIIRKKFDSFFLSFHLCANRKRWEISCDVFFGCFFLLASFFLFSVHSAVGPHRKKEEKEKENNQSWENKAMPKQSVIIIKYRYCKAETAFFHTLSQPRLLNYLLCRSAFFFFLFIWIEATNRAVMYRGRAIYFNDFSQNFCAKSIFASLNHSFNHRSLLLMTYSECYRNIAARFDSINYKR